MRVRSCPEVGQILDGRWMTTETLDGRCPQIHRNGEMACIRPDNVTVETNEFKSREEEGEDCK